MQQCETPIVFIVFNRPDVTRSVFARIKQARPEKLFLVCDAPRAGRNNDLIKSTEIKKLIREGIDWPCEYHENIAKENMGCRARVSSGISWAFEHVDTAIILEDDCLPDPTFFDFCTQLLEKYRDDESVFQISGTNFAAPYFKPDSSYFFTNHAWLWGWATWKEAWKQFDYRMEKWESHFDVFQQSFSSNWERQYWTSTYKEAVQNLEAYNTWGFPWIFTCRSLGKKTIIPKTNLVSNLGFSSDSTHDMEDMSFLFTETSPIKKLRPPKSEAPSKYFDDLFTRVYSGQKIDIRSNLLARARLMKESVFRS